MYFFHGIYQIIQIIASRCSWQALPKQSHIHLGGGHILSIFLTLRNEYLEFLLNWLCLILKILNCVHFESEF